MSKETDLIIENGSIRQHYDEKTLKWYFSVVDVVGIIAHTTDGRNYWKVLKNRLKKTQNQLVTECNQLKMLSSDSKLYLTDTADKETMLKIIKIISEDSVPYFEQYFDNLTLNNKKEINEIKEQKFFPTLPSSSTQNSYPQIINTTIQTEENDMHLLIDGYHQNNQIILKCFVAGAIIENILIYATTDTITISGTRLKENNTEEKKYTTGEISWGKFSRTITLPKEININKIETIEYRGMLTIKLPIINKSYKEKIKIKSI